jgi:hypothetical protein
MRGMMLNGKSFGMSSHGRFILKLTAERAAALVAEGVGKPFSPAPGRVMKGVARGDGPGGGLGGAGKGGVAGGEGKIEWPAPLWMQGMTMRHRNY